MPALTDRELIRTVLERDRPWAAYALADLVPGFFERCSWHATEDLSALLLVYRAFQTPVVLAFGNDGGASRLLDEIAPAHEIYAVVRPGVMPAIAARHAVTIAKPMLRMVLRDGAPRAGTRDDAVVRLGAADLGALEELYADGASRGESPEFFLPAMLDDGTYFGMREEDRLIAAAGTHVVCAPLSVGALGNIYTRLDRRNRGLGAAATRAVQDELVARRLETIVLNVHERNAAARAVYGKLGFAAHCNYVEAECVRR